MYAWSLTWYQELFVIGANSQVMESWKLGKRKEVARKHGTLSTVKNNLSTKMQLSALSQQADVMHITMVC